MVHDGRGRPKFKNALKFPIAGPYNTNKGLKKVPCRGRSLGILSLLPSAGQATPEPLSVQVHDKSVSAERDSSEPILDFEIERADEAGMD